MAKQKYYVVWVGKTPGVYRNWTECQQQIHQVADAKYKSFDSETEADKAYKNGWKKYWGQQKKIKSDTQITANPNLDGMDDIDCDLPQQTFYVALESSLEIQVLAVRLE